ncbi:hypothetical protein PR202_ga18939 [Eleusine coracana subsp. coracana]|uniref:Helicase C-terminal domain-containing protein n=1 Tax=Eleusine coracana subsp. coracana TaxID=191504 RepID=A0AAV5CUI2_ELECO|nr:hypothetical protein PR202_ga18939 [Eleusine coracana subsp. coracana]
MNLVAASHVILVQPWWNPFVEKQAIKRAHRIGQTRPVTVHRLVIKDTVEERIMYIQVHILFFSQFHFKFVFLQFYLIIII